MVDIRHPDGLVVTKIIWVSEKEEASYPQNCFQNRLNICLTPTPSRHEGRIHGLSLKNTMSHLDILLTPVYQT
ncbi:hypothetical protein TNCV_1374001 [Trichonephila clavipes]|nr:hypothetical protein TNCV_1374001 [Trichonephila clavipes]